MTDLDNPRAGIGGNLPPLGVSHVAGRLAEDYAELSGSVTVLLDEARSLPPEVADDDVMGAYARLIKRFRETASRIEALRVTEKDPHLRAAQAVDSFFFGLAEKCSRRDRKAKPGAADVLQARLDDYNQCKLRAEQERRRREAEEQLRLAREAQEKADRQAREAEEARLAAERARKPETVAVKTTAAQEAQAAASVSGIEAMAAADRAVESHVATLAKPADIVRTRVEEGPLVTMATEGYAEVLDAGALDMRELWPFISLEAKEKALRAWARNTGFTMQMAGASVGKRPKSVVR